jgi:hypothetical protein
MKAVVGLLLIFLGGVIDYFVITGKLPPQGGITPPTTSGATPPLPTASSTSSGFAATTGQGNTSGSTGTYNPPPIGGRKVY